MAISESIRAAMARTLVIIANDARNELIADLRGGTPSGRTYRRRGGVTHRASAPGEVPATDTGQLIQSLSVDVNAVEQGYALAGVLNGPLAVKGYAVHLELGTPTIAPRPFLAPVAYRMRQKYGR